MTDSSRKVSYLSTLDFYKLNQACRTVEETFGGFTTYLVGSVTERHDYRDVDVRTILDDERFDELFKGERFFWSLFCAGVAAYLSQATGLTVDYQVQRRTDANEKYIAGNRNPIGTEERPFAGGGDATGF
jgi:hypothetical protein